MTLKETLMKDYKDDFVIMDKTTSIDSFGSIVPVWKDGARFKAAITSSDSEIANIAEAIKEKKTFKFVTEIAITLKQGEFFKRLSDGAVFKVLYDNTNQLTPKDSAIPMRATEAEITELPK